MKKHFMAITGLLLVFSMAVAGCSSPSASPAASDSISSEESNHASSSQADSPVKKRTIFRVQTLPG